MQRYKLTTTFDGTQYVGWQVQPNGPTIQGELQKAFATILGYKVHVTGCGRTDSGVHAKGHIAHTTLDEPIDQGKILFKLAGILPKDIRVLSMEPVEMDFHARYGAKSKTYRYYMHLDRYLSPFKRHYCHHVHAPVDIELMRKGAEMFVGEHDFTSFAHQASHGCAKHAPVKKIFEAGIFEDGDGAYFQVKGSGFLHKMVRNMVGTLIDIGRKKIPLEELPRIMEAKDRRLAGKTAPAKGLFLIEVDYGSS